MNYHTFAYSVPGLKYTSKGFPMQDAAKVYETSNMKIIAIADGHGSPDCFLSQVGAQIAVDTAIEEVKRYFAEGEDCVNDTAIRNFKSALWNKWREQVKADFENRFQSVSSWEESEVRYKSVSEKYKARYTSDDESIREQYLYRAYGTTLILALHIGSLLFLAQVGDGSCVVIAKNGEFSAPIPPDADNFLNVSFSLCEVNSENADEKIRTKTINYKDYEDTEFAPVAIFLSSDGLDDCYPYENNSIYLYKYVYSILLRYIEKKGYIETEKEARENLLSYMTNRGSKDDISLAWFITDNDDLIKEVNKNISDYLDTLQDKAVDL